MKKTKNKILSGILALTMVVGMLPMTSTTAYAADSDRAMELGMNGIQNWDKSGTLTVEQTDKIVMGTHDSNPVEWVRLSDTGLMFSTRSLGQSTFQVSGYGDYPGSTLNNAMTALYDTGLGLSATEQAVISDTTLTASSMDSDLTSELTSELEKQKLFPLSGNDAGGEFQDYVGQGTELAKDSSAPFWWLRSSYDDLIAFSVSDFGSFEATRVGDSDGGVRPAYNLNLSSVLFTSAAVGGKSGGGEAASILNAVSEDVPTTWKMTLKDNTHTLSTAKSSAALTGDSTVSVNYTDASEGHTISAMVINRSTNEIMNYGNVATNITSSAGKVDITLPNGFDNTTHKLVMFTETLNGENKSDLASEMVEVDAPAPAPSSETDITAFEIAKQVGASTIDTTNHTVEITMPYGTDVKTLIPEVEVSPGAKVTPIGEQDFTKDVTYTVTAENGTTTQDWKVSVSVELAPTPTMTKGTNQTVIKGESASFTSDGDFSGYIDTVVTIDGKKTTIHVKGKDNDNVSVKDGSIVVTLSGAYTKTLPIGTHTITINSEGGSARAEFKVIEKTQLSASNKNETPKTGDNSNAIWYLIVAVLSLSGIGLVIFRKRIQKNKQM